MKMTKNFERFFADFFAFKTRISVEKFTFCIKKFENYKKSTCKTG